MKLSSTASKHTFRLQPGDTPNILSLLLTAAFALTIALRPGVFSASYLRDGFCVSFPATLFNSHLLCFYIDTLFTVLLHLLCARSPSDARLARVRESYWGVFGHGVGHLALHASGGGGVGDAASPLLRVTLLLALAGFWYGFFCALTPSVRVNLALSLANTAALALFVPRAFGFTYVQTVLMSVFVTRDLVRAERKDELYRAWSWLVNVPVVVVGWVEALGCDSGVVLWGGHVLYDAIIPLSLFAFAGVALSTPYKK